MSINDDLKELADIPTSEDLTTPHGCFRLIIYLKDINEFDNFVKWFIKYKKDTRSIIKNKPEKYDAKYWISLLVGEAFFSPYILPMHIRDFLKELKEKGE